MLPLRAERRAILGPASIHSLCLFCGSVSGELTTCDAPAAHIVSSGRPVSTHNFSAVLLDNVQLCINFDR